MEARLLFPAGPVSHRVTRILDRTTPLGVYIRIRQRPRAPNISKYRKSIQSHIACESQNLILQDSHVSYFLPRFVSTKHFFQKFINYFLSEDSISFVF